MYLQSIRDLFGPQTRHVETVYMSNALRGMGRACPRCVDEVTQLNELRMYVSTYLHMYVRLLYAGSWVWSLMGDRVGDECRVYTYSKRTRGAEEPAVCGAALWNVGVVDVMQCAGVRSM